MMPPSWMEGGSQWCRAQAQLAFFPYPTVYCFWQPKQALTALTAACTQLKATYLILLLILYSYCHFLSLADSIMLQKKKKNPKITSLFSKVTDTEKQDENKQKRIPSSEQKFSTCQIPRAFSDLSRLPKGSIRKNFQVMKDYFSQRRASQEQTGQHKR